MKPVSILIVEDELDIQQLMWEQLSREGHSVTAVQDSRQAYDKMTRPGYQLVILDWMIPEVSGLELLRWMRHSSEHYRHIPVLFVTAKSSPTDIVQALEMGADDYITKPFDFPVFKARVHNLIKRMGFMRTTQSQNSFTSQTHLKLGELSVDTNSYKVFINKEPVVLTLSEFRLLEVMLRQQGKALSRQQLVSFIQGEEINVTGRTIDTHISILRKKLGKYGQFIETVRGIGYRVGFI